MFTFDANVKGLFFFVQKGVPLMKDGGSIILNASIADIKGFPAMSMYKRHKSGGSFACPDLDERFAEPSDPRECSQPRSHR